MQVVTGERLQAQVEQHALLERELELARSREVNLTTEKDAAIAHGNSLESQVVALQNSVIEKQNLVAKLKEAHSDAMLKLEAQTEQNVTVVKLKDELNACVIVLGSETWGLQSKTKLLTYENTCLKDSMKKLKKNHVLDISDLVQKLRFQNDRMFPISDFKQLKETLNTERQNCRVLEQGIDERISNALDTQLDELNVQLNNIVQSEQQRLAKVHEAAMSKQQEIHQKALSGLEQKVKLTQEKNAQAETAAQLKIRELETRLETLQLKFRQVECDAQNKAAVANLRLWM